MNITTLLLKNPFLLEKFLVNNTPHMSLAGIDECGLSNTVCGKEAGCYNTKEGYECLCSLDLKPVDPKTGSCDRNESSTGMSETSNPDSTVATFGGRILMRIFSGNNGSNLNSVIETSEQNISKNLNYHQIVNDNPSLMSFNPIIFSLVILFAILLLSSFGFYYRRRIGKSRKRNLSQIPLTGTLSKCMQQYVTNPNYYASSPDAPMLKLLKDIELSEEDITFEEAIGEGCFGTVFKGTYKKSNDSVVQVAIKVLKDKNETHDDFEREIEIISSFNHMNIIQLIGVVVKDPNCIPYMVFEYMMYGDLAELLRTKKSIIQTSKQIETINEINCDQKTTDINHDELIWISTQIANGCKYLADNHFVHRDLATRNCLVGSNMTVKISDFGMSRDIYTCDYYKVGGSKLLPVRWMSPESILYGKFTLESDVWSFGVVLWEIFTLAKQPYFGHNNEEVVKLILQGILLIPPEDCPKCIYELMAGCWKTEPRNRFNFTTILNILLEKCQIDKQKLICINRTVKEEELVDIDDYLVPNHSQSIYCPTIIH